MRRFAAVGIGATLLGFGIPAAQAGAASAAPPTYPLGAASSCKAHYVEKILNHKVKGKSEPYIACVYATQATTTTSSAARTVPNLIDVNLATAESRLDAEGIGFKVVGGGVLGVVISADWTVCDQSPLPGKPVAKVSLFVERSCS